MGAFLCLAGVIALTAPARLRVARDEVALLVFYGIVGFALVSGSTSSRSSGSDRDRPPPQFTAPLLVALWARLVWHEAVRRRVWAALALALFGLALVAEVWRASARRGGVAGGAPRRGLARDPTF